MKVFSIWLPIIFCALAFGLHSCTASREYEGEYPELFSQACYTLTYAEGKLLVHYAPALEVLETDEYGRTLFAYSEVSDCYVEEEYCSLVSLLVCQFSEEEKVWFYEDISYLNCAVAASKLEYQSGYRRSEVKDVLSYFTASEISELKEKNDWGQPIAKEKCIGIEIARKKASGPFRDWMEKENVMKGACQSEFGDAIVFSREKYMCSDAYGRSLHYIWCHDQEENDVEFIVILDGEHSYFARVEAPYNCQEELRRIKTECGWGTAS